MTINSGTNNDSNSNYNEAEHPRDANGAQWVDRTYSGPEINLGTGKSSWEDTSAADSARDYAARIRHSDAGVSRRGAEDMLAEVQRTMGRLRSRTGLSFHEAQDAVGDTMVDLLGRTNNGHNIEGGLVQWASNAVASRFVNGPELRHETTKGITLLKLARAEREAETGQHMTSREIDEMAEEIRMGPKFNPQHRPIKDYQRIQDFIRPTSFSQFPDSYIDEQMHAFGYGAGSTFDDQGSASDRLAAEVEEKRTSKAAAMKRLWEVTAEDQDVPKAAADRIGRTDSANVQNYMSNQTNGVMNACREHEEGLKNKNTYALFAPFADLTANDRDNIVAVFLERSGHAEALWSSALNAATKSKETEASERAAVRVAEKAEKSAEKKKAAAAAAAKARAATAAKTTKTVVAG